jgi:hypothetical protein
MIFKRALNILVIDLSISDLKLKYIKYFLYYIRLLNSQRA